MATTMMIKHSRSRSAQCNNVMVICGTQMVHTQVQLNHVKQTSICFCLLCVFSLPLVVNKDEYINKKGLRRMLTCLTRYR